jgi:hypothetical protein
MTGAGLLPLSDPGLKSAGDTWNFGGAGATMPLEGSSAMPTAIPPAFSPLPAFHRHKSGPAAVA